MANDVYNSVLTHIQEHETRGFNAHHRAQDVCEYARKEIEHWLTIQHVKSAGRVDDKKE